MSVACIYDCPTNCAFTENDASNDNDESNGRKNGRFCGFATVRSMTDFHGLCQHDDVCTYRTIHLPDVRIIRTFEYQGHRLRG
jgi:hypothetical protein